jgi:hypothetical protein
VYMEPLVEELLELWISVVAYDVTKPVGFRAFMLHIVLLWTIHDFLGYGIVVLRIWSPRIRGLPVVWTRVGGGTFCGARKTDIRWNKEMASEESQVSICSNERALQW